MTQAAAADKAPGTLWGRLLGMLWMIASVIFIGSFTAGTTAQLAAQRLESAVRTSADLGVVRTGSVSATAASDYLKAQHVDVRNDPNVTAGLEALRRASSMRSFTTSQSSGGARARNFRTT